MSETNTQAYGTTHNAGFPPAPSKARQQASSTPHNPNPWVIVEQAGTDDESIRDDFPTFAKANKALADWYYADELESLGVQIMRRLNDGTLTTEF